MLCLGSGAAAPVARAALHKKSNSWFRMNRNRQGIFPLPPGEDEGEGMRYSSTTCSDCVSPNRRAAHHFVEAIISSPHLASPGGRGTHHRDFLCKAASTSERAGTEPCTLREFLLYFVRLGSFGFGGPIALLKGGSG